MSLRTPARGTQPGQDRLRDCLLPVGVGPSARTGEETAQAPVLGAGPASTGRGWPTPLPLGAETEALIPEDD